MPRIVLHGGRKPVKVKRIVRGKYLGGDSEGFVYKVKVVVGKGTQERVVELVEKEFHKRSVSKHFINLGKPKIQYKIMRELLKINSKKKLGLHIIPTIRLRKRFGKNPTLVMTRLKNEVDYFKLTLDEKSYVRKLKSREEKILQDTGFMPDPDMWICNRDPKTNKIIAWIADFGSIKKTSK